MGASLPVKAATEAATEAAQFAIEVTMFAGKPAPIA
jgi:hypothetical protein